MLETIYAAFGEIYKGQTGRQIIKTYNASDDQPLHLEFSNVPKHLAISVIPEVLEPKQEGNIEILYRTDSLDDWDFVVDRLDMSINGNTGLTNRLNVTANVREDFSQLTAEDLTNAPRIGFDQEKFNFDTIQQDQRIVHQFILTNMGKTVLRIRKVSSSCECTAVQPERNNILPGDTARITAIFDPKGQEGEQTKAITVITNDPRHFKTILWIEGFVITGQEKKQ